ncbi:MAG TPA: hypothetical protein VN193_08085 [Candidatus Angelobacter sp.]|nr:hypothetical protein [Candidatus Angelobacter sp.]
MIPTAARQTVTAAAATTTPSAVGNASVSWLAVSPGYQRTGLVVAMVSPLTNCNGCIQLWVSHNGGATWSEAAAKGWNKSRPSIAYDGKGHDTIFAAASTGLQRSDDGGNTWTDAGPSGSMATVAPSYPADGSLAVAGAHDYILSGGQTHAATGSGGAYTDYVFSYPPSSVSGGSSPAALLSAIDSHSLPVILQCDQALSCHGAASLPGAGTYSAPTYLALSSDFASDGVVFAQSGRGVYKSSNAGGAFVQLPITGTPGAAGTATPMLALAPGYREAGPVKTVYVSVFQVFADPKNPHTTGGVYQSSDGGTTWSAAGSPSPLDGGSTAVAVAPDGRLFAGYMHTAGTQGSAGLLCSVDGRTWAASCPSVGSGDVNAAANAGSANTGAGGCSACPASSASAGGGGATPAGGASGGTNGQAPGGGAGGDGSGANLAATGSKASTAGSRLVLPLVLAAAVLAVLGGVSALWRRRTAKRV